MITVLIILWKSLIPVAKFKVLIHKDFEFVNKTSRGEGLQFFIKKWVSVSKSMYQTIPFTSRKWCLNIWAVNYMIVSACVTVYLCCFHAASYFWKRQMSVQLVSIVYPESCIFLGRKFACQLCRESEHSFYRIRTHVNNDWSSSD